MSGEDDYTMEVPYRQPAYDAVYVVIRAAEYPAHVNGVIWRAVEAALDAMLPAERARIAAEIEQTRDTSSGRSAYGAYTRAAEIARKAVSGS